MYLAGWFRCTQSRDLESVTGVLGPKECQSLASWFHGEKYRDLMLDTGLCGSKKEYQSLAIWFSGTQYRDLMLVADTWRTCSLECQ